MKPIQSAIIAAAALMGATSALATTATTVPVGYISLTVPAASDTNIAVPLQTASVWSGASTGITADTVSVAASSFTASQFGAETHMLQVTSGPLSGRIFPILSNATGNVVVDPVVATSLQAQGFVSGNTFTIRPYWTLDTLFPAGAGVGQNSDPNAPTSTLFFADNELTGTNRSLLDNFLYYDGSQGGDAGWYDVNNTEAGVQGGKTIQPSSALTVRNLGESALNLVVSGEVPSVSPKLLVVSDTQENDNVLQVPLPVDTSLNQSQLFESGAVAGSPDPNAPTDVVFVYDTAGTGLNPSTSSTYLYYNGSEGEVGWYDANNLESGLIGNDLLLKAGSQIIIRKAVGVALQANTWTAPLPYSL